MEDESLLPTYEEWTRSCIARRSRCWSYRDRELTDGAINDADRLVERFNNVSPYRSRDLVQGYINGHWELRADGVIRAPGKSYKWEIALVPIQERVSSDIWGDVSRLERKQWGLCFPWGYIEDAPMFVCNVEVMDHPKYVVPSLVRFEASKDVNDIWGGFRYFSVFKRAFKTVASVSSPCGLCTGSAIAKGEVSIAEMALSNARRLQNLQRGKVQGTSGVMDSISEDCGPHWGDFFPIPRPELGGPRFTPYLNRVSNWLSFPKSDNFRVEVRDVMFGPFNLKAGADEQIDSV